jgi:hypothetical protein
MANDDAHLYGPGPKAQEIEQRVREEHPDASQEELNELVLQEVCAQITRESERREKLDPIGTELWAKGRGKRAGKGFA